MTGPLQALLRPRGWEGIDIADSPTHDPLTDHDGRLWRVDTRIGRFDDRDMNFAQYEGGYF